MRFTSVFVAGAVAVLASAQSSTATDSTPATTTVGLDPVQSSQIACYEACDEGDVECKSHCVAVPAPDEDQVNDTNACVADCDQGDGSQAQTDRYAECVQGCISQHFYKSSGGTPQATGSSDDSSDDSESAASDATQTGTAADSTNTSESEDENADATATDSESESSGTATGAAATSATTGAAANLAAGSAGFVGFLAAVLAL